MTPTQRSKAKLVSEGYTVAVVEKWNPHARVRQDLYGLFDLLALRQNELIGVQTTSGANVSARVNKMRCSPILALWLGSNTRRAVVHGWAKRGQRGRRKVWQCREVELKSGPELSDSSLTVLPY